MIKTNYVLVTLFSMVGVYVFSHLHIFLCKKFKILLDYPNDRSSHSNPTPTSIGLILGLFSVLLLYFNYTHLINDVSTMRYFLFCSAIILIMGFLDDVFTLSSLFRLNMYFIIAIGLFYQLPYIPFIQIGNTVLHFGVFGYALYLIIFVWNINVYNFMDGSDGLILMHSIILFLVGGGLLFASDAEFLSIVCLSFTSLLIITLLFNFPPKTKAFLGDSGSTFIGFTMSGISLYAQVYDAFPSYLWVMLHGSFLFDATVTLIRRINYSHTIAFKPHRQFVFQRLMSLGCSKFQVLSYWIMVDLVIALLTVCAWYFYEWASFFMLIEIAILVYLYSLLEQRQPMVY